MFRKDPDVAKTWDETIQNFSVTCKGKLSRQVLHVKTRRRTVFLLTCTFSPIETRTDLHFENFRNRALTLMTMKVYKGCPDEWEIKILSKEMYLRIFPHHMEGEGHFLLS